MKRTITKVHLSGGLCTGHRYEGEGQTNRSRVKEKKVCSSGGAAMYPSSL